MSNSPAFFGTETETHYRDAKGRWWLVQSPDMGAGILAVSSEGPSPTARELRWYSTTEMHPLAYGLDRQREQGPISGAFLASSGPAAEFMSLDDVRTRFGEDVWRDAKTYEKGEAEQIWSHETTLFRMY